MAPQTRNVPKRVRAVEEAPGTNLADAQKTMAERPASYQHRAVVPQSPNRIIAEVPKASPVTSPVPKAAVKVPDAPEQVGVADAKAQSGAAAVPTNVDGIRRVSTLKNMGKASRRYILSSTTNVPITTVLLSLVLLLFETAAANT